MQAKMQLLKALQELDQELSQIRQQQSGLEQEQAAMAAEEGRVQDMVDSLLRDLEGLESERNALRQSLGQEQEQVQRSEGRLSEIKTQKEYLAVLKEIDTAKKVNKDLLDKIQEKESQMAALRQEMDEKQSELDGLRAQLAERGSEISAALEAFGKVLEEKDAERQAHLEPLPSTLRKRYQQLMDRRGGIAVVEAKDGTCTGCHMHLPPQLFNSLYRTTDIQSCPHCSRLLFVVPISE